MVFISKPDASPWVSYTYAFSEYHWCYLSLFRSSSDSVILFYFAKCIRRKLVVFHFHKIPRSLYLLSLDVLDVLDAWYYKYSIYDVFVTLSCLVALEFFLNDYISYITFSLKWRCQVHVSFATQIFSISNKYTAANIYGK